MKLLTARLERNVLEAPLNSDLVLDITLRGHIHSSTCGDQPADIDRVVPLKNIEPGRGSRTRGTYDRPLEKCCRRQRLKSKFFWCSWPWEDLEGVVAKGGGRNCQTRQEKSQITNVLWPTQFTEQLEAGRKKSELPIQILVVRKENSDASGRTGVGSPQRTFWRAYRL